jgi:hypothetical protein
MLGAWTPLHVYQRRFPEAPVMRLIYLGKTADSGKNGCPALYATDRGTYVVQGKVVTDPDAVADLRELADDESFVEVPADVLRLATLTP